jgi:putative transposase
VVIALLVDFAHQQRNRRSGDRRAWDYLDRVYGPITRKRVQRLWQRAKLQVPKRRRRKRKRLRERHVPPIATRPREVLTYSFIEDSASDGRKLKILTVVDEFTRECLAILVARSIRSAQVIRVLAQVFAREGAPAFIRSDNGPEFIALAVCAWIKSRGANTYHIDPGSPWQNAYEESFHSRFRDEFLDLEVFHSVIEAQVMAEEWRRFYNDQRKHSSLGRLTPAAFCQAWRAAQA